MKEGEFDEKCGIVQSNVDNIDSSKKMRIEDILAEQMPDIVSSNTPEPTVEAGNSVAENVVESGDPDVEMESVDHESEESTETVEEIKPGDFHELYNIYSKIAGSITAVFFSTNCLLTLSWLTNNLGAFLAFNQ
jgi:hypothetical protein